MSIPCKYKATSSIFLVVALQRSSVMQESCKMAKDERSNTVPNESKGHKCIWGIWTQNAFRVRAVFADSLAEQQTCCISSPTVLRGPLRHSLRDTTNVFTLKLILIASSHRLDQKGAVTCICVASLGYCIFVAVGRRESSWRDIRLAAWTMDQCAREEVNSISQTYTYKTSHRCFVLFLMHIYHNVTLPHWNPVWRWYA